MQFIRIDDFNIDTYKQNKYPEELEILWNAGKLEKSIIDNFSKIIKLDCCFNYIRTLDPLIDCDSLCVLDCANNPIKSLDPLAYCTSLRELICYLTDIESLGPLTNCINLEKIDCSECPINTLEPLANCINLRELNCCKTDVNSLEPLSKCINLEKLICDIKDSFEPLTHCPNLKYLLIGCNNHTIAEPLSKCAGLETFGFMGSSGSKLFDTISNYSWYNNLKELYCNNSKIITIEQIAKCVNLELLSCDHNQIKSLKPLINCVNLKKLYCSHNRIKSLDPIYNIKLERLFCENNKITSLYPLNGCTSLKRLYCNNNLITSLLPLSSCTNLKMLRCDNNQITSLVPLIYLRQLSEIDYDGNPLEIPTNQVLRFLDRVTTNCKSSIYHDNQNVHDSQIQLTVCQSVQNLLRDTKPIFSIDVIIDSNLKASTKEALVEYCQDQTVHSIHLITYEELLSYVWQRIVKSEHHSELFRILEEQIIDSECKCYTGRFNRTLSVLVGFYNDIRINISDKSRISAIILVCRDKVIPYDSRIHQELAKKELFEAGYTEEEINPWIEAIAEIGAE